VLDRYLGSAVNLTAIRTIRVLRPLRAINRVPSMRILVNLLLDTLPMLGNVLLLCFFVFFIFGIVGVQLWAGVLRNRCVPVLPNFTSRCAVFSVPFPMPQLNLEPTFHSRTDLDFYDLPPYYTSGETGMEYLCSLPKDNGMHRCPGAAPTLVENERWSSRMCQMLHVYAYLVLQMHTAHRGDTGAGLFQQLKPLREFRSVLHQVRVDLAQPLPRLDQLRQHRLCLGVHFPGIFCKNGYLQSVFQQPYLPDFR